jgi:transposase InsO family protein
MMDEVMNWISFYKYKMLHSVLGYVNPMEFERRWHAARKDVA